MRIGFFWNDISNQEYEIAVGVLNARRNEFHGQFETVETCQLSLPKMFATFEVLFQFSEECRVDFAILSHHSAWATDPLKLKILLDTKEIQEAAISVRAGKIYAKAGIFSPKVPYIDPDFIIVNIRKCVEIGIPERISTVPFASHFTDAGGIHADLMAFLETIVPYGALYVYDDGSALRDLYGCTRARGFTPTPYLVDTEREFVSYGIVRDPRIHILRSILLQQRNIDDAHIEYGNIYIKDGFPFFKEPFLGRLVSWAGQIFKNAIRRINFEIHKKYIDKT